MAKAHSIKILEFSESKITNTITLLVRASDLLRTDFPDYPNLRQASKNHIVKGIIKTIEQNKASFVFPEPVHISAKSYEKLKISGTSNYCVDLQFRSKTDTFIGDGIMNGGHRIHGLHQALLAGFNLDNVFLKLEISLGLTDQQIRDKCLILNSSKSPTRLSKYNYSGVYDWMKELLPEDQYSIIYYENHSPKGIPHTEGYCMANRISILPIVINPKAYNGKDPISSNRHPYRYAYPKEHSIPDTAYENADFKKLTSLLPDLIKIQSYIGKCIEQTHLKSSLSPWVKNPKTLKECTHFPDGVSLTCKIPSQLFTAPIISCFRPWLTEDFEWILPFDQFSEWLASKLWGKYKQLLKTEKRWTTTTSALAKDSDIWDSLYTLSESLIEVKFNDLKKSSRSNIKTKRVA